MPTLVFMLDGSIVGHFLGSEYPRRDGRYPYMPYRGPGHHQLGVGLREGQSVRCYFETEDAKVSFIVGSCPEYGVLELADFQASSPDAA